VAAITANIYSIAAVGASGEKIVMDTILDQRP
jgi:hypothetical protein